MREKVKVLTLTGEYISLQEWQQKYGLQDPDQLGKYFSLNEPRFRRDIAEIGHLVVCEPLMVVGDRARELWDRPLTDSSFNRNAEKQLTLREDEKKEKDALIKRLEEQIAFVRGQNPASERIAILEKNIAEIRESKSTRANHSPHVVKLARDFDMGTRAEVLAFVPVLQQAAKDKNVTIRIGYKEYLAKSEQVEKATGDRNAWTFVHFDVCPEYFAPGKPWHDQPHPKAWEVPAIW